MGEGQPAVSEREVSSSRERRCRTSLASMPPHFAFQNLSRVSCWSAILTQHRGYTSRHDCSSGCWGFLVAKRSLGTSATVEKHLDQLDLISTAFVVPALIVLLAAAGVTKGFEILGLHLDTENAYGIVGAIYDCLLLLFATTSWKTGDFLKMCTGSEVGDAIAAILTHKWFLNPFSYSGSGGLSALLCGIGSGLLTMIWWVGLCSLRLLSTVSGGSDAVEKLLLALYLIFGITSAVGIIRLIWLILQRVNGGADHAPEVTHVVAPNITLNLALKATFSAAATTCGIWLYHAFAHLGI